MGSRACDALSNEPYPHRSIVRDPKQFDVTAVSLELRPDFRFDDVLDGPVPRASIRRSQLCLDPGQFFCETLFVLEITLAGNHDPLSLW